MHPVILLPFRSNTLAAIAAVQTFPNPILVLDGDPIPPDEFLGS